MSGADDKRPDGADAITPLPDSGQPPSENKPGLGGQREGSPRTPSPAAGQDAQRLPDIREDTEKTESDPRLRPARHIATPSPGGLGPGEVLLPQQVLAGRYRIVRLIGRGGMGEVYEAEDLELKERVALKTIRADVARDARALDRFRREIQLARKVTHPNVCRIFHLERDPSQKVGGITFLTMELVEGETLAERLKRAGRMTTAEALPLVEQMAAGLEAAHRAGIVHRDFKSGNVVLASSKQEESGTRVVITDFGLARATVGEGASAATLTEGFVGTPAYMAPEQLDGGEITAATDVYALGVVMYEMVTGRQPFAGDTPLSTALKRLKELAPSPRLHVPDLDPRWEAAILRCLERNPAKRFQSAGEVVKALAGERVGVVGEWARRRRLAIVAAAVLAAFVLAAWGYRSYLVRRAERSGAATGPATAGVALRPAVAVMGFTNLTGRADTGWVSTALSEILTTELGAGEQLRMVSGEDVAHVKIDLSLPDADSYAATTLGKLRKILGVNYVVLGSYLDLGKESGGQVRLDVRLQDAAQGDTIASVTETGTEANLSDLVSQAGAKLRSKLGAGAVTATEADAVKASLPSNPEAARLYSEGLTKLRLFDNLGARGPLEKAVEAEPDFALAHAALAEAWGKLGFDDKAKAEAEKAFDLSLSLSRQERLLVEGRYQEASKEWDKAIETYQSLFAFFPDNLDYGLRLTGAETSGAKLKEAAATIEALRGLAAPARDDPRIDLAVAKIARLSGDFRLEQSASARAASKANALGARLILARALGEECWALMKFGEASKANPVCEQARQIFEAAGDRGGAADTLNSMAARLFQQGDFSGAERTYRRVLATYRESGNRRSVAVVLNNIGNILMNRGDLGGARETYEQSLAISRDIQERSLAALTLGSLGFLLHREGELAQAERSFREALADSRSTGSRGTTGLELMEMAFVLYQEGHLGAAKKMSAEALAINSEIDDKRQVELALSLSGLLLAAEGKLGEARQKYLEALALQKAIGARGDAALVQVALADLSIDEGKPLETAAVREALEDFRSENRTNDEVFAHTVLARASLAQGKYAEAQSEIAAARDLAANSQDRETHLRFAIASARARAASGKPADSAEAIKDLEAALAEARKYGFVAYQFEARLALAQIQLRSGDTAQGRTRLTALQKDAEAKGFGLVARKAREAATRGG